MYTSITVSAGLTDNAKGKTTNLMHVLHTRFIIIIQAVETKITNCYTIFCTRNNVTSLCHTHTHTHTNKSIQFIFL